MMNLFDDTIKMDAHFYLTGDGDETTRDSLLREMRNTYPIYMVYLGRGYMPLKLAVQGFACEQDAWEGVQVWAHKADCLNEIGEDVECPHCGYDEYDNDGEPRTDKVQMLWDHEDGDGDQFWKCPGCHFVCQQRDIA